MRHRDVNANKRYKLQAFRVQRNELLILAGERAVKRIYEGDICTGFEGFHWGGREWGNK